GFDEGSEESAYAPGTVVPVAGGRGAPHIVVANDLEYERYHTRRPQVGMQHLLAPAAGLRLVATFGDGYVNQNAGPPIVDPIELQARYASATPLPEVAIFPVPGAPGGPAPPPPTGHQTG